MLHQDFFGCWPLIRPLISGQVLIALTLAMETTSIWAVMVPCQPMLRHTEGCSSLCRLLPMQSTGCRPQRTLPRPRPSLHHGQTLLRSVLLAVALYLSCWPLRIMAASLQKELSEDSFLYTSFSSDCLYPFSHERCSAESFQAGMPQRCSSPQLAKLQHEPGFQRQSSESDENRPAGGSALDVHHSLPSSFTEHVRLQAKARIPRVRLVRKASAAQLPPLDSDSRHLTAPSSSASPGAARVTTAPQSALQVSWPLPAAVTTVALTDLAAVEPVVPHSGLCP